MPELVKKYGEPIFVRNVGAEQCAYFDLTIYHEEFQLPKLGRIGFTATMRDGKIVEWKETTRSNR